MIFHLFLQKQQIDPVNSISFFQYKILKKMIFFVIGPISLEISRSLFRYTGPQKIVPV
jgi:hypothetical protein